MPAKADWREHVRPLEPACRLALPGLMGVECLVNKGVLTGRPGLISVGRSGQSMPGAHDHSAGAPGIALGPGEEAFL